MLRSMIQVLSPPAVEPLLTLHMFARSHLKCVLIFVALANVAMGKSANFLTMSRPLAVVQNVMVLMTSPTAKSANTESVKKLVTSA